MREIALECKPDEALVKALGYVRKRIVHQTSRGEVVNYLSKNPTTIGIVDEDPGSAKPTYFSTFECESKDEYGIESFIIRKSDTRLILIKPRLEEWILSYSSLSGTNPRKFFLPDNSQDLHKIINSHLVHFENMVKEMLEKSNPALLRLRRLIDVK